MGSEARICLFGPFVVERQARKLRSKDWPRRKAAWLLQRLAIERRLPKERAIDFLWPNLDSSSGANNLYRTLHSIRKTLDEHLGAGTSEEILEFEDGVLSLPDQVWIDIEEFSHRAKSNNPEDWEKALALYKDDLLTDELNAEFTAIERDALRRLERETRLRLAAHYRQQDEPTAALTLLSELLARDPADETAHRETMLSYASAGRRHDALRQYQACLEALDEELGLDPSPETRDLHLQLIRGNPIDSAASTHGPWSPAPLRVAGRYEDSPTIGRGPQEERLLQRIESAEKMKGGTVMLIGEAGVGKTRLALKILEQARERDTIALTGACYEQEGQIPFQPFMEAFDRYLYRQDRDRSENPLYQLAGETHGDPQQHSWRMFRGVAEFLSSIAKDKSVILVVDDLHEADEASLRLFHFLARSAPDARWLLLATARPVSMASASSLNQVVNSLYQERLVETIELDNLDEEATGQLVKELLGGPPTARLAKSIHQLSHGNPFFIEEVVQHLIGEGRVQPHDGEWHLMSDTLLDTLPAELIGLLRDRVARLGDQVEPVLLAGSVIGHDFSFEVLRRLQDQPASEILDALDYCLEARLLDETSSGYRFRHTLIRRALYNSLSRTRRLHLHRLTAEAIESMNEGDREALDARTEDLAFHYSRSDQRHRALDYLIRAGNRAKAVYAYEVAVEYYEQALELIEGLSSSRAELRFEILTKIGSCHTILADTPRAVDAYEAALSLGQDDWEPTAEQRSAVRRDVAIGLITAGQIEKASDHLDHALKELEGHDESAELAHVLYNVAQVHWHRNEFKEAFDVAQQSLHIAEGLDDEEAIARAFEMLALACHSLGEWQQGLAFEHQRQEIAGAGLDVSDAFDVHL